MKNTGHTPRTRRTRAANTLFVTANALLVLGVLAGVWWWYLNRLPALNVPAVPTPPNPNGYDRLITADGMVVRMKEVGEAVGSPESQVKARGRAFTRREREEIVAANAEALETLREAIALPIQGRPLNRFDQTFPEFAKMRSLARLLSVEGKVHEEQGDTDAAAGSYLDAMQMGNAIPNGGPLIARLVGIACEAIGRRPLVPLVDRMSATEARATAARLEAILAAHIPIAQTLENEKWGTQNSLHDLFRKQNVVRVALEMAEPMAEEAEDLSPTEKIGVALSALRTPKAQVLASNARYMDAVIAQMKQPYDPNRQPPAEPGDAINRVLTPVFIQSRHKDTDTRSQNALLLGKLALRAYHEERGDYPQNLSDLVSGGYLKAVPADPFARNGKDALRYQRVSATAYTLYSVGPDGADDGGKPIVNRYDDGREKRWTEPNSKGDFVFGVNLY